MIYSSVPRGLATSYRLSEVGRDYPLARNFALGELACKSGADEVLVHPQLVQMLQAVRDRFGVTIVTSGYRTNHYNLVTLRQRGYQTAANSLHVEGYAADISVPGTAPREVYAFLEERFAPGGLGLYNGHVHVDVGASGPPAGRWNRSAQATPEPGDYSGVEPVVGPPVPLSAADRLALWLPGGLGLPAWVAAPDAPAPAGDGSGRMLLSIGAAAAIIGMGVGGRVWEV